MMRFMQSTLTLVPSDTKRMLKRPILASSSPTPQDVRLVALLHLARIQRLGRAFVLRKYLSTQRRTAASARISRWFFARPLVAWRFHKVLIASHRAAIVLQKVWRGARVRHALVKELADHAFRGATLLQHGVDAEVYQEAFEAVVGAELEAQRERARKAIVEKDPTGAREYGLIAIKGCPPHVHLLQRCATGLQGRRILGQLRAAHAALKDNDEGIRSPDEHVALFHRRLVASQRHGFRLALTAFLRRVRKESKVPTDYLSTFPTSAADRSSRLEALEASTKEKYKSRMEAWTYAARQRLMDQRLSTATSFLVFLNRCALTIQRWYRHIIRNRHIFPQVPFTHANDEIFEAATQTVEKRSVVALRTLQHKQLLSVWEKVT